MISLHVPLTFPAYCPWEPIIELGFRAGPNHQPERQGPAPRVLTARDDAMFQGQRGWFCRSVSQDLKQFWGRKLARRVGWGGASRCYLLDSACALASTVAQGGMISDPQAAEFLFSCDASHPDTLRYWGRVRVRAELGVPLTTFDGRLRWEASTF